MFQTFIERQARGKRKCKVICLLVFMCTLISSNGHAFFNSCRSESIDKSVKKFINQYYEDYSAENREALKKYFFDDFAKGDLDHLIRISRIYKINKIEILRIKCLSKKPLTMEVEVKEWYKPEVFPPPNNLVLYKLRSEAGFTWKIIEIGEPAIP